MTVGLRGGTFRSFAKDQSVKVTWMKIVHDRISQTDALNEPVVERTWLGESRHDNAWLPSVSNIFA